MEDVPGKVVNVPGVDEIDIGKSEGDCSLRFRESRDVQVRP